MGGPGWRVRGVGGVGWYRGEGRDHRDWASAGVGSDGRSTRQFRGSGSSGRVRLTCARASARSGCLYIGGRDVSCEAGCIGSVRVLCEHRVWVDGTVNQLWTRLGDLPIFYRRQHRVCIPHGKSHPAQSRRGVRGTREARGARGGGPCLVPSPSRGSWYGGVRCARRQC